MSPEVSRDSARSAMVLPQEPPKTRGGRYAGCMFDRLGISTLLVVSSLVCGCGAKERVSVSASLLDAELSVEEGTLGTFLSGGFDLSVRLGPNAPQATTVSLESFSLVRASDQSELIAPLPLVTSVAPFELAPGDERTLQLELDGTNPIGQGIRDEICAEPVLITGTVTDTESEERSTPVQSDALSAGGCS